MVYCAAGAALLAVSSWITIPLGVLVFTMQSFAVFLLLETFGWKNGSLSILVWLLLGAVGVPVFSAFRGGVGVLLGVTGGYIWGFGLTALYWWLLSPEKRTRIFAASGGLLLCYACGTAWFFLAYTGRSPADLGAVILRCAVPYLLPDAIKLILALRLSARLAPVVKL